MDGLTRFLTTAGRHGGLGRTPRRLLHAASGFSQALTTARTVKEFLTDPDVTVPYHERSELLGVGGFPLALDGQAHGAARTLIAGVLDRSAEAGEAGITAAAALADSQMATAGDDRLDLIGRVVDPALETWIETWYGLDEWGPRLMRTGRLILHATFLNPKQPKGHADFVALRRAIDTVDQTRLDLTAHLAKNDPNHGPIPMGTFGAPPATKPTLTAGTIAAELLEAAGPELAARHLLGLTVGPLALGSHSIANVLDELLDQSWTLDGLTPAPGEGVIQARRRAEQSFGATLARRPPLPGVARRNPVAIDLVGAGGRTVSVPQGDVLVATQAAMAFDPQSPELAFGHGLHACMGRLQITQVAGALLVALAGRSPRRVPGPAGQLTDGESPTDIDDWPFPGHLEVALLR